MTASREPVLSTVARYATSSIFRQVLGTLTAFIQPKLLSPALFGLWTLLKTIPAYGTYAHLGARDRARYLIPLYLGEGQEDAAARVRGTLRHGSLAITLALAAAILPFALFPRLAAHERVGIIAAVAVMLVAWQLDYVLTLLKAEQRFRLITRANYVQSLTAFGANLALILILGIYGLYLAAVGTLVVTTVFLLLRRGPIPRGSFSLGLYREMMRSGFPITLFYLLTVVLITSGRILVSWRLDNEQLGYYSLSVLVVGGLMQIPGAARDVMEPRLMQSVGQGERRFHDDYLYRPLVNTAFYMPFLLTGICIALPLLCDALLPRYVAGVIPAQITCFGAWFLAMVYVFRGVIVATRRQGRAAALMSLPVVGNLVAGWVVLDHGGGIAGMAVVTAASCGLLFALLLLFVEKQVPKPDRAVTVPVLLIPLVAMLGAVLLAELLRRQVDLHPVLSTAIGLGIGWTLLYGVYRAVAPRLRYLDRISIRTVLRSLVP